MILRTRLCGTAVQPSGTAAPGAAAAAAGAGAVRRPAGRRAPPEPARGAGAAWAAARTSALTTRPFGPLPLSVVMSTPSSRASRRALGLVNCRPPFEAVAAGPAPASTCCGERGRGSRAVRPGRLLRRRLHRGVELLLHGVSGGTVSHRRLGRRTGRGAPDPQVREQLLGRRGRLVDAQQDRDGVADRHGGAARDQQGVHDRVDVGLHVDRRPSRSRPRRSSARSRPWPPARPTRTPAPPRRSRPRRRAYGSR